MVEPAVPHYPQGSICSRKPQAQLQKHKTNLQLINRLSIFQTTDQLNSIKFTLDPKCKSQKKACASELPLSLTDQRTFSKARRPRA